MVCDLSKLLANSECLEAVTSALAEPLHASGCLLCPAGFLTQLKCGVLYVIVSVQSLMLFLPLRPWILLASSLLWSLRLWRNVSTSRGFHLTFDREPLCAIPRSLMAIVFAALVVCTHSPSSQPCLSASYNANGALFKLFVESARMPRNARVLLGNSAAPCFGTPPSLLRVSVQWMSGCGASRSLHLCLTSLHRCDAPCHGCISVPQASLFLRRLVHPSSTS